MTPNRFLLLSFLTAMGLEVANGVWRWGATQGLLFILVLFVGVSCWALADDVLPSRRRTTP